MKKLTNENAFVGCRVKINNKDFNIIKVNDKSFYATEMGYEDFLEKEKSAKSHRITFVQLCKNEGIKSYKYDGAEFDENQPKPIIKEKKKDKKLFDKHMQNTIKLHYERMLRLNSRTSTIHYEDYQVTMLGIKDGISLISYNGDLYLYDVMSGCHTYLEPLSAGNISDKNIPWEAANVA